MTPSDPDLIIIMDHDPLWPGMFEIEKGLLLEELGGWPIAIEHIGSTAVQGLCAKPIIDIMIGVSSLEDANGHFIELERLGYMNVPGRDDDLRLFFRKGMPRTHHVHIVVHGSDEWSRHISFRDALRADPDLRDSYAILKQRSATRFKENRQAYVDSKNELIESALQRERIKPKMI